MTNFLLSKPEAGNYPCNRYASIEKRIAQMEKSNEQMNLLTVGNTFGQAAQPPREAEGGRIGGTVYTSFIDVTDNKFYLSYKLSNEDVIKLDLSEEFSGTKRKRIKLRESL
jgi:choloylglycine hydrolase